MFKRIAVCLVVTVAVSAACFIAVVAWMEKGEETPVVGPKIDSKAATAAKAYQIDRKGRKLAERGHPAEDIKKAEEKYQESLAIFRGLKHERGEAEVLNDLGILYSSQREYAKAAEYMRRHW